MQLVKKVNTTKFDICFDASSKLWTGDPCEDYDFLVDVMAVANKILRTRGYVYLYEIYRMLELPNQMIIRANTSRVGWHKKYTDWIDFDILEGEYAIEFLEGDTDTIWLHFNLDGVIYGGLC